MNFIRIGKEIINLDMIKRVEIVDEKSVIIYFSLSHDKDFIIYKGKPAKFLSTFFEANSRDIAHESTEQFEPVLTPPVPEETDVESEGGAESGEGKKSKTRKKHA